MARVLNFYRFSVAQFRQQLGSASESVLAAIAARFESKIAAAPPGAIQEGIRARSVAARRLLTGADAPPEEGVEPAGLFGLTHELIRLDPQLGTCPDVADFLYALSMTFCLPNPDVDGVPLTSGPEQRRVGRHLHSGRPFFGSEFPDGGRHGLYGWLSGEDEGLALSQIVRGDAWHAYTKSHRYKAARRPALHEQRSTFGDWLLACSQGGNDIFFTSTPLDP
jgi:hypothetical protein